MENLDRINRLHDIWKLAIVHAMMGHPQGNNLDIDNEAERNEMFRTVEDTVKRYDEFIKQL